MHNTLYYGDNLDVLRRYVPDAAVDLVYLDPPFNSSQSYNVLFQERDGARAASQIQAFEDTWTWDAEDELVFAQLVTAGGKVADVMQAFRTFLGPCDMLAYLVMMAPRLVELRRVMKPTASIYLHCDPTASHYLKLLLDAVFGPENFRNEIVWQRTGAHSDAQRWGRVSDSILFYTKTGAYTWGTQYEPYSDDYVKERYHYTDEKTGRLFWPNTMTAAGPGPARRFRGKLREPPRGTHWRFSQENIDRMESEGRIYYSSRGVPYVKSFLHEQQGKPVQNIWADIRMTKSGGERLGYPTQKPEALLERILKASSNEGDLVLDPFCGCGTTIAAAQKLNRRWIGIDITHLAITLIKQRLKDAFGVQASVAAQAPEAEAAFERQVAEAPAEYAAKRPFHVVGEPVSVPDAQALAASDDHYQFQWWALGLVGARPAEGKKGADKGIDGRIVFQGDQPGKFEHVVLSVKAGNVTAAHVRDLRGVIERDKAALGALLTMEDPSRPMKQEAATAGFYESKVWNKKYPRLQILTIPELLAGQRINMPPIRQVDQTFKKAPRAAGPVPAFTELPMGEHSHA